MPEMMVLSKLVRMVALWMELRLWNINWMEMPTVPFQLSNTFSGLSAGNYTVTIKDSKGCLADTSITLSTAAEIIICTEFIQY